MTIYQCDFCGKQVDKPEKIRQIPQRICIGAGTPEGDKILDMCADCERELNLFLAGWRVGKEVEDKTKKSEPSSQQEVAKSAQEKDGEPFYVYGFDGHQYTKDLKACYITEVDESSARNCLSGDDRVLCSERKVTGGVKVTLTFRKEWFWRLRPQFGYLEMGFESVYWARFYVTKPDKVIPVDKEHGESHKSDACCQTRY